MSKKKWMPGPVFTPWMKKAPPKKFYKYYYKPGYGYYYPAPHDYMDAPPPVFIKPKKPYYG
jgi:hypothetical protein